MVVLLQRVFFYCTSLIAKVLGAFYRFLIQFHSKFQKSCFSDRTPVVFSKLYSAQWNMFMLTTSSVFYYWQ